MRNNNLLGFIPLVLLAFGISVGTGRSQLYVYEAFDYGPNANSTDVPVEDKQQLQARAEAGDAKAQTRLAEFLYTGQEGFDKNRTEAYKWSRVAFSQGAKDAKHLLTEFDLFTSVEEREKGKALAEDYLEKRRTESKQPDDKGQEGAKNKADSPQPEK